MIRCNNCGKDFADSFNICPYCNTPVKKAETMSNDTMEVMQALKEIYATYGIETIHNKQRFISILRDYIPEYEKERRLLITAIENNVVESLVRDTSNHENAIAKARTFMENDMFLSKVAVEFIIQTITYMLGWDYKSADQESPNLADNNKVVTAEPKLEEKSTTEQSKPIENRLFGPAEASKFRLKGTVEIPYGYTAIKDFAFDGFSFLKSVIVPEGVVAIGSYAFSECSKLTSVSLPISLRFIKASAFEQCTKLTKIEIPKGVVAIEDCTFQFCENLEEVIIPNTVGSIGAEAFSCCESLKRIRIPDSVKYIGEGVFEYCSDIIVECYEYSYVHKFCQSTGIMYELIKD